MAKSQWPVVMDKLSSSAFKMARMSCFWGWYKVYMRVLIRSHFLIGHPIFDWYVVFGEDQ
jgi:hypothetical protein